MTDLTDLAEHHARDADDAGPHGLALVQYEQVRQQVQLLAKNCNIDDVKSKRDKSEAMAAYARQAKDTEMIKWATEIKVWAERRCGELLRESAQRGERATKNGNVNQHQKERVSHDTTPTLAQIGITRDESSRYQRLASIPADKFEAAINLAKEKPGGVTTAFMLKQVAVMKPIEVPEVLQPAKHISKDKRAEQMRELVEAGHNVAQIAKTLGIGKRYVLQLFHAHPDIPRPAGFGVKSVLIRVDVVVNETVSSLTGLAQGIELIRCESFESISAEQAQQMASEVAIALSSIRWLATKLKGVQS